MIKHARGVEGEIEFTVSIRLDRCVSGAPELQEHLKVLVSRFQGAAVGPPEFLPSLLKARRKAGKIEIDGTMKGKVERLIADEWHNGKAICSKPNVDKVASSLRFNVTSILQEAIDYSIHRTLFAARHRHGETAIALVERGDESGEKLSAADNGGLSVVSEKISIRLARFHDELYSSAGKHGGTFGQIDGTLCLSFLTRTKSTPPCCSKVEQILKRRKKPSRPSNRARQMGNRSMRHRNQIFHRVQFTVVIFDPKFRPAKGLPPIIAEKQTLLYYTLNRGPNQSTLAYQRSKLNVVAARSNSQTRTEGKHRGRGGGCTGRKKRTFPIRNEAIGPKGVAMTPARSQRGARFRA
ncbi:hypothetical protein WN48_08445 [Eufriesea mexicana]|uniref:Uncharacterized protein n=1 Tax=Eufriesea mexicana TaxID=516756 RepID=A0A310SK54_9HYME|nr:hypothetical protein WN48_08445 [Eufriesea mexicana]